MNNKNNLEKILKTKKLSVYGLSKQLNISPQACNYIVKTKDLNKDYQLLKTISNYCGETIENIIG